MAQAAGFSFNTDTVAGSKVRDLAGYFLDGTIVGSAAITTGKSGYGNALNCTGGALQIPVLSGTYPIDTSGGLTLSAWVKLNTTTAAARCIVSLISNSGATRDAGLYASNASGNVELKLEGATHTTTTSIRDGNWHHVMAVVDRVFGPGAETVRIVVDGTQVLNATGLTTGFGYTGNVTVEVGRNGVGATEVLDGIVDDFRWWNDPVSSASWAAVMGAEQEDLQYAIYPFDDATADDYSIYNRDLTKAASASFATGLYGKALTSASAAAGATAAVNFGNLDRLAITGWIRLDVAPSGSASPIMAIANTGATNVFRAVVNTDRTITCTWVTIYGTFSVTSTGALTVGVWSRFHFNMNPTYVGVRLNSNTQQTTSTGNSDPHLTPTVNDLKTLYVGGDAAAGGQVSYDYLTFTRNFIDLPANSYWAGPPVVAATKPANLARGIYEANENTGTTVADGSGNGNGLTLTAAGSWITGVQGSAVGSNGTGPGAQKASGLTWSAAPAGWAFSGWFKCRSGSSGARIFVLRNGTSEVAHVFYLSGAFQLRLYDATGNTGILSPNGSAVTAETWTHLAASCNGSTVQFFKNGVRYGSVDYTRGALLQPNQLYVGGDQPDGSVADFDSLTLFDTPLSSANVAWLYANPGLFTPTTQVTSSRATTWNTRALITAARSAIWDTRAVVTSARPTTWDVRTVVTATRATTWSVKARVTSARATSWRVLESVTKAASTTWDVLAAVTVNRAAVWDTLKQVTANRVAAWDTREAVTANRPTLWRTLARVTATRSTTWNVDAPVGQVTSVRSTTWVTKSTVAATRSTLWRVRARVTSTRSTTWDVDEATGQVTSTRTTSWTTKASVTSTRTAGWRVAAKVTAARATAWDVLASVTRTRATTWRVLKAITTTRTATWNVDGPAAQIPPGLTATNAPGNDLTASNTPESQLEVSHV